MAELFKAFEGIYTEDCRVHACQKCGACDFKTIKPVVQCKIKNSDIQENIEELPGQSKEFSESAYPNIGNENQGIVEHYRYRLYYARTGDTRFVSHLEVIQTFFQAFRRANLQFHFSQGFNPVPKVSFSQALPVGTESMAEYMDVDLKQPIADEKLFLSTLNQQLPKGFAILKIVADHDIKEKGQDKLLTCYQVRLSRLLSQEDQNRLQSFLDEESVTVVKLRKGKKRIFDIRKQVTELQFLQNGKIELTQISYQDKASSKPMEIIKEVFGLTDHEVFDARIIKLWSTQTG
jgi:radical SAM-linked protein